MQTYQRLPIALARGEGARVWDTEGREYLDALSGIAVVGLGHAHPKVTRAITEQAGAIMHSSNLYRIPAQEALGDKLAAISGMDRVFFCNSGAEANEAAIKLARLHGHKRGIEKPVVLVAEGSFHGRTLATLSATGNKKVQAGFEPLVEGFHRVPYNDLEAVRRAAAERKDIAAVLVEPVQGEGGINCPDAGYLKGLRELCDEHSWLLMLDEIQSGMGRTGHWFAHQAEGITPDVMSLAKGLGNGYPIGACLARGEAAELFGPGSHGTTFGGNHLASRVGLAVIEAMEEDGLVARAAQLGQRLLQGFQNRIGQLEGVRKIRGHGLMLGIELDRPAGALVAQALQEGLLINVTAERVVRLLPPLVLSDAQADRIVDGVSALIERLLREPTEAHEGR